jgi:hypothetical protein
VAVARATADFTGARRAVVTSSLAMVFATGLLMLAACQTQAEQQAAKNAEINRRAAAEISRICALPDAEREAELQKIKEQSGVVLYCGSK